MRIINTADRDTLKLTPWEKDQCYNGLDVCVTHEVHGAMSTLLSPVTRATYEFSKSLQGPVLDMGIRGVDIDHGRRIEVIDEFFDRIEILEAKLLRIVHDGCGMATFNVNSHADLRTLFYDRLGLPVVRKAGRPTTDRGAREQLGTYAVAAPLVEIINTITELNDKIAVLRTKFDDDNRIRTSYNIAGTSTGRFSSSLSAFGTGGNLQNIEESLRSTMVAPPGWKFAKCDAKSGESFCVGAIEWNLFQDGRYLDACESGDPHTAVARIVWPNLGWTGDLRMDKALAEQPFYRHHSYRFMCKKLGHGSNYGGGPDTLAEQTKLPINVVAQFQPLYFRAFPGHRKWHQWVDDTLRRTGNLTTLTGRRRWFFGRRNDQKTLRDAMAYDPQGSLADIVNRAMLSVWRQDIAKVVMQDHDAITFMYKESDEDRVVPLLMAALPQPLPLLHGRTLTIPYDCKVGWNKGDASEQNPNGLEDYSGHDDRKRQTTPSLLDRIVHRKDRKPPRARNLPEVGGDLDLGGDLGAEGMDQDFGADIS